MGCIYMRSGQNAINISIYLETDFFVPRGLLEAIVGEGFDGARAMGFDGAQAMGFDGAQATGFDGAVEMYF